MKQQRHFWKLEKDWERVEHRSGKVRTEVCSFCGCKRETWKFDYLPKGKSFYLFLKPNSKKKKFTTEHIKCDRAFLTKDDSSALGVSPKEILIDDDLYKGNDNTICPEEQRNKAVSYFRSVIEPKQKQQPQEFKIIKHNPVALTNVEAQLKDSIMIIQLLITKMEENNLKGKEFEIANRFISSVDVKNWKEKFNKTAI